MTTVLQYLVIASAIGLVVFGIVVFVFGRGEQLAPLSPRTSPTELPEQGITSTDIGSVKFAMALRGYRMSDVDWAMDRLATEIDRLRAEISALGGAGDPQPPADVPVFADVGAGPASHLSSVGSGAGGSGVADGATESQLSGGPAPPTDAPAAVAPPSQTHDSRGDM